MIFFRDLYLLQVRLLLGLEAIVLAIDTDRERISLGIKQLDDDPFANWISENPKGSIVKVKVSEIDSKNVTVRITDDINGVIHISELSVDEVSDARPGITNFIN